MSDRSDPDMLIEAALAASEQARILREAARNPDGRARVQAPDGRLLTGEQLLAEADVLDEGAHTDLAVASALTLTEIRDILIRIRDADVAPPVAQQIFASAPPGPIPHPGSATVEDAPRVDCPIRAYHSNHLWWSTPHVEGMTDHNPYVVHQVRYFCPGVRWSAPVERVGPDFGDKA